MTMTDKALIEGLQSLKHRCETENDSYYSKVADAAINALKSKPMGKWELHEITDEEGRPYDVVYLCSNCEAERPPLWCNYCSCCGIQMEV